MRMIPTKFSFLLSLFGSFISNIDLKINFIGSVGILSTNEEEECEIEGAPSQDYLKITKNQGHKHAQYLFAEFIFKWFCYRKREALIEE